MLVCVGLEAVVEVEAVGLGFARRVRRGRGKEGRKEGGCSWQMTDCRPPARFGVGVEVRPDGGDGAGDAGFLR